MAQVYKITNTDNMMSYIGISVASDSTYLDRFSKHLSGDGGVWIKRAIESGSAHPSNFIIEVLEESDNVNYIAGQESYYIDVYDTLWPNGYNGNKGNYIIRTPETVAKAADTKKKRLEEGKIDLKGINKGHAIYRYPDGNLKSLSTTHPDVVSGAVKHQNYDENCKSRIDKIRKDEERLNNNGLTDKELLRRQLQQVLWSAVHKTEWWLKGRETYRNRMSQKLFTAREKELYYERRSDIVKNHWSKLSNDDRTNRTTPGLQIMNSEFICEHCGTATNKGNYTRWHGTNCKHQQ